jgi:hypothetical protein
MRVLFVLLFFTRSTRVLFLFSCCGRSFGRLLGDLREILEKSCGFLTLNLHRCHLLCVLIGFGIFSQLSNNTCCKH